MRRWALAGLGALVLSAATVTTAVAAPVWCIVDPIVSVHGRTLHVTTAFEWGHIGSLTGPVRYEFVIPENVDLKVLFLDSGPVAEEVVVRRSLPKWRKGPLPVTVNVTVRASASFLTFTTASGQVVGGPVSAVGESNVVTTLNLLLGKSESGDGDDARAHGPEGDPIH